MKNLFFSLFFIFASKVHADVSPRALPLLLSQATYAHTPELSTVELLDYAKNIWKLDGLELSVSSLLYEAAQRQKNKTFAEGLHTLLKEIERKCLQLGITKESDFFLMISLDDTDKSLGRTADTIALAVNDILTYLPVRTPLMELPESGSGVDIAHMVKDYKDSTDGLLITTEKIGYRLDFVIQDLLCHLEEASQGARLQGIRLRYAPGEWGDRHDLRRVYIKTLKEQVLPRLDEGNSFEKMRPVVSLQATKRLKWDPKNHGVGAHYLQEGIDDMKKLLKISTSSPEPVQN